MSFSLIFIILSFLIFPTCNIYGLSQSKSNQSLSFSFNIDGANGLKLSLNFTFKFKFFCIFDNLGSPRIDLFPSALGPNYKKDDTKSSILEKGNKNFFASSFKKFIGYKKDVLEVGCGTGQLSIYFSIGNNNNIVGLDPTIESLQLGKKFIDKNNLKNVNFVRADIFDDVLKDNIFDFIWCNGVLHHTKNPSKAFDILIKSLKKEGYVLIGLYNKIGRIRTLIRKYLYKLFGITMLKFLDPTLKNLKTDDEEQKSWIRDQYLHPIESLHTIDEVLVWFKKNNIK